ncbi:hypothetical protein CXZ10_11250 [Pleomorphomonas diazotrophica]|uniref:Uncharacterized protein n=1 Tax=Pleomorphomonas diazotrophica TaxID=1166257 RepID=A0A2N3LWU1_9HYPH|nr:hypothetical protein CXZ10_11250 [Pleomorphomonas diazotrophica]
MTTAIDLLEDIYQELREAGLVGSKAEFSEGLLVRSRSYLTSMRARDRHVSNDILMTLRASLSAEIEMRAEVHEVADRLVLRRARNRVEGFLGEYPLQVLLQERLYAARSSRPAGSPMFRQ